MGKYSKKGTYAGYDRNHKERQAEDYYATPPEEVYNILNIIKLPFNEETVILDPGCGGGHLIEGILAYSEEPFVIGTDIKERDITAKGLVDTFKLGEFFAGEEYDFLLDDYDLHFPLGVDYVIMNPPFSCIIPFTNHALSLATKGVLMLGRLEFLESKKRYEKIFQDNPPTDVYIYVDRIACYKNGDFSEVPSSIQAYAWYYWDKQDKSKETKIHWIRRYNGNTEV